MQKQTKQSGTLDDVVDALRELKKTIVKQKETTSKSGFKFISVGFENIERIIDVHIEGMEMKK